MTDFPIIRIPGVCRTLNNQKLTFWIKGPLFRRYWIWRLLIRNVSYWLKRHNYVNMNFKKTFFWWEHLSSTFLVSFIYTLVLSTIVIILYIKPSVILYLKSCTLWATYFAHLPVSSSLATTLLLFLWVWLFFF